MRWGESARLLNDMGVCAGVRGWEGWQQVVSRDVVVRQGRLGASPS